MLDRVLGTKLDVTQRFTEDGQRVPVTWVKIENGYVFQVKRLDKDGYNALQIGWGKKDLKRINKPLAGHLKGAKLNQAPYYLSEVRVEKVDDFKLGEEIKVADILKPGDKVRVTGVSKGKGFTGVVKRWHFAGGPRTHGQSDRERAPGSIGQTTTPGRVLKGKKMAGRTGGVQVTVSGLTVVDLDSTAGLLLIKGLVPGSSRGRLIIKKIGKDKRFVPLLKLGEKKISKTGEEKPEEIKDKKEVEEKPQSNDDSPVNANEQLKEEDKQE